MSADRIYRRDKETRKTKAKIRAESKAGMYDGPGLGQAKGREMTKRVKAEDKKDAQKYGGMDMPTKEQAKKMAYGGKAMKMAKGGEVSDEAKKQMREETSRAAKVAEAKKKEQQMKKKEQELKEKKRKSELANKVYKDEYKKYQKEENNPNSRFPKADKALYRFGDKVGDVARKIGKKFGSNRVTSQDDEAQMQARKDVKGFKEGGKIRNSKPVPMPNPKRSEFKSNMPQIDGEAREKAMREKLKKSTPERPRYDSKKILDKVTGRSASRRIASGGKVKKMAHGGSVSRGDGCAVRGKTKGRMV